MICPNYVEKMAFHNRGTIPRKNAFRNRGTNTNWTMLFSINYYFCCILIFWTIAGWFQSGCCWKMTENCMITCIFVYTQFLLFPRIVWNIFFIIVLGFRTFWIISCRFKPENCRETNRKLLPFICFIIFAVFSNILNHFLLIRTRKLFEQIRTDMKSYFSTFVICWFL